VQLVVLTVLKSGLHLDYLVATGLAVEAAVIHNFLWHERFTWADRGAEARWLRFVKFHVGNGAVSILGNVAIVRLLAGVWKVHYLVANAVAIAVCSFANFLLSDRFVFGRRAARTTCKAAALRKTLASVLLGVAVFASGASIAWGVTNRDNSKLDRIQKEIVTERERQAKLASEKQMFMAEFLGMSPTERVDSWEKSDTRSARNKITEYMVEELRDALVASGTDAAPYLARVIHTADRLHRIRAVDLLCSMDRFVRAEDTLLPEVAKTYVESLNLRGLEDPFMTVDGRRIGKEGYDAIQWAATQTGDQKLRSHARYYSGLLRQDLSRLSLPQQIEEWKAATIKCNHTSLCVLGNQELELQIRMLDELLAEEAPQSIPPLVELLNSDRNGFVRMGVVNVLEKVDSVRMRLSGTEIGCGALDAMLRNLDPNNSTRFYPIGLFQVGLTREHELQSRRERFASIKELQSDDHLTVELLTDLTIMFHAFAHLYGENISVRFNPYSGVVEPTPKLQAFVAYLTRVDPHFPSWDYFYPSPWMSGNQVLHPHFRQRVERYYGHWKAFKQMREPLLDFPTRGLPGPRKSPGTPPGSDT
jgi:putative flippase GtrA